MKRQQANGLSIRAYCLDHDLHESAFYFWRREVAARDRATPAEPASLPAFVPVQVIEAPPSARTVISIRLASGHRLHVRTGCDRQLLADVVAVRQGQSC